MLTRIRQWVMPPAFEEDKDKSRASILLNIILGVFFISALGYAVLVPIVPEMRVVRAEIITPFLLILIFLKSILNRGYVRTVGTMTVFALWLVFTVAMLFNPDYNNPAYMGYLVVVICAGLVLSWRATMAWSLFVVLTNAVILLLEQNNVIPNSGRTVPPIVFWMAQTLYIFISAFLLSQALRKSDEAIERSERELIERQHVESALREAEHNYRSIFENATEGILQIAADGKTLLTNPAAARMLGYDSPEEVLAAVPNIVAIYVDPARRAAFRRELETYGEARDFEVQLYHKSGRRIWVSINARAVRDAHGTVLFHEGFTRDITKRKQAEEELRESEERYRAVVENQTEFIVRWKAAGMRTFVNEAYCRYFELTYEQAISTSFFPLLGEEERAATQLRISRLTSGAAKLESYVQRVKKPDGSLCWQEWTDQGIWDESNQFVEFQSVGRDITERKRVEEKLRQRAEQMSALYDIGLTITSNLDLNQILHDLFEKCKQLLPIDTFYIAVYDETTGIIRHPLFYDGNQKVFVHVDDRNIETAPGLSGYIILSRTTLYLPDEDNTTIQERYKIIFIGSRRSRSYVGVPMFFHDSVVGVLSMQSYEPDAYSPEQIRLLETIAIQAAIAIANARLYQDAMQASERRSVLHRISQDIVRFGQDSEQIYKAIHEAAGKLMPCDVFIIAVRNDAKNENDMVYVVEADQRYEAIHMSADEGFTGAIINEGESLILRSTDEIENMKFHYVHFGSPQHVQSVVAVPMRIGDKVTGMTSAQCYGPYAYSEEEQVLLEMLSTYAAIAIENARLYESEQKRRQEAETLRRAATAVTSTLDSDMVMKEIFAALKQVIPYDSGSVFLLEGNQLRIVMVQGYSDPQGLINRTFPADDEFFQFVERTRRPIVVTDAQKDPRFKNWGESFQIQGWMAIPLIARGKVIGGITLDNLLPGGFDDASSEIALAFASQATAAIENARLYEAEQQRRQEAETLRESLASIVTTLDLDTLLDDIVRAAADITHAEAASILLYDDTARQLYFQVATNTDEPTMRGLVVPLDKSIAGWIVSNRKSIRIDDASKDERIFSDVDNNIGFSTKSLLGIPLVTKNKVVGVLEVLNKKRGRFTDSDESMLTVLGAQAAATIENARLYESEQQRRQEAETLRESLASIVTTFELVEVVERILDQIKFVIPYDTASVWRVDGEWLRPIVGRDIPPEAAFAEMRLRIDADNSSRPMIHGERAYLLNNNVQEELKDFTGPHSYINSWLAVPLKKRGKIIGQISLDGRKRGQFTAHHAELAVTFADQVAIALENASLYEEIQQELIERKRAEESLRANEEKIRELNASLEKRVMERTEQLQAEKARIERVLNEVATLRRLSDFLQASMTVKEACQIIIGHMNSLFSSTSGALYLTADSFADLSLMANWGHIESETVIQPDDCWGMRRGRVFVRHRADAAPACIHFGEKLLDESMCLPLLAQNETIGMLCMQVSDYEGQYFTADVQNLAVASADSIALALANLRLRERLRSQSIRDPLTGIFNRRYLEETLAREVHRASRTQHPLCVIMFEVDDFKIYNNTYGHDAGDYVLRKVADTMRVNLRRSDFPCRYGGDEFTLILPDTTLEDGAHRAEELRKAVEALALSFNNQALGTVTVRMGVAAYPQHGETGEAVLQVADDASYRARAIGKNCVVVAE